jgi:hypothetical protein
MKLPGISLAKLMFIVAIIAVDFGLLLHPQDWALVWSSEAAFPILGLLPMANLIVLGLPGVLWFGLRRRLRRVRRKPFAVGFQVTSWAATLAVLAVCVVNFEIVDDALSNVMPWLFVTHCVARTIGGPPVEPPTLGFFESCWKTLLGSTELEEWVDFIGIMAFFSLPPLLVSLAGGVVTRFVVRRRSRAAIVSPMPMTA